MANRFGSIPSPPFIEESVHVPLLILGEGRLQPQIAPELGSHIDLLPTLMDILSLEGFTHSTGKSLMRREEGRNISAQHFWRPVSRPSRGQLQIHPQPQDQCAGALRSSARSAGTPRHRKKSPRCADQLPRAGPETLALFSSNL